MEVKVKVEIVICYGRVDEQVVCNKIQQALVNMRKTFMTQLPPHAEVRSEEIERITKTIKASSSQKLKQSWHNNNNYKLCE